MPRRDFLGVESSLNPEGDLGLAPQWLPEKGFLNARVPSHKAKLACASDAQVSRSTATVAESGNKGHKSDQGLWVDACVAAWAESSYASFPEGASLTVIIESVYDYVQS